MRNIKKYVCGSIVCAAIALMCGSPAWAIPAKPGLIVMRQPDGTELKVRVVGDEHFHYYLSEDGFLLVNEGETFYYGNVDDRDHIVRSDIKARPAAMRSAKATAYLRGVDMERVTEALVRGGAAARSLRRSQQSSRPAARSPRQTRVGLFETGFPATGDQKALVVLVEYQDVKFTLDDPYSYFSRMLNEDGFSDYNATGSAAEYFRESSTGQFRPQFDVYGPITLSENMAYYGGNGWGGSDQNPQRMVIEACQQLDDIVDFSEYDRDGDGYIDNIFVFYAGRGEASGGSSDTVWPHSWYVTAAENTPYIFDGVQLDRYACGNEWQDGRPDGVGTFVHEFSHVLGLPDLYATNYSWAFTPGRWSALDLGPYNNNGCTPPLYSVYERYSLGWMKPRVIDAAASIELKDISTNQGCVIPTANENEFFLLENRQQKGWDTYIPGHGMLVWHVDYYPNVWTRNTVNNDPSHQYVDIEEADNQRTEGTRAGDAFPGTAGVTSFTDDTSPSMRTWDGEGLGLPITDIAEVDGIITFYVAGGMPKDPVVALEATDVTPESFTAHWLPVDLAVGYALSVYASSDESGEPVPVDGYDCREVGDTTAFDVTGLIPATKYRYVVWPVGRAGLGEVSNEIAVTTADPTLRHFAPVADDATDVTDSSFIAHWQPLDGATAYRLSVCTRHQLDPVEELVDFTGGLPSIPEGWTTNTILTYANAAYSGEAVPSLRFATEDCYIMSPVFDGDVLSLGFWHRGVNAPDSNRIVITASADGNDWVGVDTIGVVNDEGGCFTTISSLPEGMRVVRVSYDMRQPGSLALDDIHVTYDGGTMDNAVGSFDAGSALSLPVTGLDAGTTYYYIVTATDGEQVSRPSNEIAVTTGGGCSGIASVAMPVAMSLRDRVLTVSPCGRVSVTDVSGRVVFSSSAAGRGVTLSLPAAGVYVVMTDGRATKIVVR